MQDFEDILEMFEDYKRDPRPMDQEPRNMELAKVQRSEMDNFNTPDLDQGADSILKPGETLEDDFDVTFRRPNAQGGRIGYAEAKLVDPDNKVKKGQDLGRGIQQRLKGKKIVYITSGLGEIPLTDHKTYKIAKDFRQNLIADQGDPKTRVNEYKGKYKYKELIKDKDFKNFWESKVDNISLDGSVQGRGTNQEIEKVRKKYKLKPTDYEDIFDKLVEETRITESVRKGVIKPGQEKLVSNKIVENLIDTFNNSYKPNIGTINTNEMGKLLGLSDGELSKLMGNIDKPYPDSLLSSSSKVSRIDKANILKNKLAEAGIEYERTNINASKGISQTNEGLYRFKVDEAKFNELSNDPSFGFAEKKPPVTTKMSNLYSSISRDSDEYKKFGYSKDSGAIQNLRLAMNNGLKGMNDKELLKFIKNNPKLKNLVTLEFNPEDPKMFTNKDIDKMDIGKIRQNVNFEVDHIRGKATVAYDPATKKILDGLGLEYPKNLYIVPKGINVSTKMRVENYVAENPSKKNVKMIDDYFKKNQITYFNRNTQNYGGYKPSASAVGLNHLGITSEEELKKLITGTYVDSNGETKFRTNDPDKLIATINEAHKAKGGKPLTKQAISKLRLLGKKGEVAAGALTAVLGYNFGESFLKDSNIIDKKYQDTASLSNAPIVEEGFTTGEKAAAAGAASLVVPAVRKVAGTVLNAAGVPLSLGINAAIGIDPKSSFDRTLLAGELALAPGVIQGATSVTDKIKNPLVKKITQTLAGVRIPGLMNPANAMKIARVASPLGIASLGAEAIYNVGKLGYEDQKRFNALSPEEQAAERAEQEKFAFDIEGS